jgi:dienelactone hydrolase
MSLPGFTRYIAVLGLLALAVGCTTNAVIQEAPSRETHDGLTRLLYPPSTGKGPIVVIFSGYSGTSMYEEYAVNLAKEGYYVVLLDGKDILTSDSHGEENLKSVIARAQQARSAIPGRAAVIGFSYGGGAALVYAANMPELVSTVVAYFPYTAFADAGALAARFRVPVLFLAGEQDRYNNCCTIETAHAIYLAAKDRLAPFTLIAYPDAGHGFSLPMLDAYRPADTEDAWKRTLAMLQQHHRLGAHSK